MPSPASSSWVRLRAAVPALASALLLVLSLACGSAPPPAAQATPADDETPRRGGTVRVGVLQEPSTFIDWSPRRTGVDQMAAHLVFRRLARPGTGVGEFHPDLAESWEFGEDGRSILFRLRPGFTWEDGRPVTSADVVFTVMRAARPGAEDATTSIVAVEARGADAVLFRFKRPYPEMLADAAVHHIYPEHLLAQLDDPQLATHPFNREPVGSGPFRLEERKAQQYLSFVPREDGPAERAWVDRVVLRVFSGKEAALRELEGDNVDVLFRVPREHGERLAAAGTLAIHRFERRSYFFIAWNARRPRWQSPDVRRAMTAFIDRRTLAEQLQGNENAVTHGPVPPDHPWYEPLQGVPELRELPAVGADPAAGSAALERAGWRRGEGGDWRDAAGEPAKIELVTLAGNAEYRNIAIVTADQLRSQGLAVDLRELELAQFQARLSAGSFDGIVIARGGASGVNLQSCFGTGGQDNYGGHSDAGLDAILAEYAAAVEAGAARDAFRRARARVVALQPWTFLYYRAGIIASHPRLRGVTLDPREPLSMADRWWLR